MLSAILHGSVSGGGQSSSVKNRGNAVSTAFSSFLTNTANNNTSHGCSMTIQKDPKRENFRY